MMDDYDDNFGSDFDENDDFYDETVDDIDDSFSESISNTDNLLESDMVSDGEMVSNQIVDIPETDSAFEDSDNLMAEDSETEVTNQILEVPEDNMEFDDSNILMEESSSDFQNTNQILEIPEENTETNNFIEPNPEILDKNQEEKDISENENQEITDPVTERMNEEWDAKLDGHNIEKDLGATNPHFSEGLAYQENCPYCVAAYEMQSRGYDVEAKAMGKDDYLCYYPEEAWENADVLHCNNGTGKAEIEAQMAQWGDGARAEVSVAWKNDVDGHVFIAEQVKGETHFMCPQSNDKDCSGDFQYVKEGETSFWRIDNLQPSARIFDCCERSSK